jgi:hypothetical protein
VRRAALAALIGAALLAVSSGALAAPAGEPKAAGVPAHPEGGPVRTDRPGFAPVDLPDSIAQDLRLAWALRARVGQAYWPEWAATRPASLLLRGDPFDYFVNHPAPPGTTTAAAPLPGGPGTYHTSLHRLPYPDASWTRIESHGGFWCVPYSFEKGRPGTRAQTAAMLAVRDFLVYQTTAGKPVWATPSDTEQVRRLRSDPDLLAWLDQEGVALRQAVAEADPARRAEWVHKALAAAAKADEAAARKPDLVKTLAWLREARRFEGSALYMRILLEGNAAALVQGDTAQALPGEGAAPEARQRLWRERAAGLSDRSVTGGHLGSIGEAGAYSCVLLDMTTPGWRKRIFQADFRLSAALAKAFK